MVHIYMVYSILLIVCYILSTIIVEVVYTFLRRVVVHRDKASIAKSMSIEKYLHIVLYVLCTNTYTYTYTTHMCTSMYY